MAEDRAGEARGARVEAGVSVKPPRSVQLPSGRVITLAPRARAMTARRRARGAALFAELSEMIDAGDLALRGDAGAPVLLGDLALADFHALRAIATHVSWIEEETIDFPCKNCGAAISVAPCAALALGPFVDRELGDPELDRTLDLSTAHAIPDVKLLGGGVARDVRFEAVSVARAAPLHRALAERSLAVTANVVRAMGIASLGSETSAARTARAVSRCSEAAWRTITDLFLDAHYPPRLFAIALCSGCGARNDVDAPYDREFVPWHGEDDLSEIRARSNGDVFPTFDDFDARANAIGTELLRPFEDKNVLLVVDGGVPACDDGGEPLLGSYVPPYAGDATTPSRAPEVTVYYRTFRAIWDDEGPYDWESELRETIEHELEHHGGHLRGHDEMDEEERRAIDDEAAKVLGKRALARGSVRALGTDFGGFMRRTWPIWLLLIVVTLVLTMIDR
jgi:hypothetical protein